MIFVDTSGWVALRNRRDPHHDAASALLREHSEAGLVTTNHVRGETWTYLRRRGGHGPAVAFLDALRDSPRIHVVRVDAEQEEEALGWLRRHDEREYSFVDATSFVVMRAERLSQVMGFDGDFTVAGFVELRP